MANLDTLVDDFNGNLSAARWATYTNNGGTITVANNGLLLNTAAPTNNSAAQITSVEAFTLGGSYIYARIDPSTAPNVATNLEVFSTATGTRYMHLRHLNGQMQGRVNTQTWTDLGAYSPTTWKYWRIGLNGLGGQTFERSADGVMWTMVYNTMQSTANFSSVRAQVYAQATVAGAAGTSFLDAINMIPVVPTATPSSISDPETLTAPTSPFTAVTLPGGVNDPQAVNGPMVTGTIMPGGINDSAPIGTPDVLYRPGNATPDPIVDLGPVGTPAIGFVGYYSGNYGENLYGQGTYGGFAVTPDSITDPDTTAAPTLIQIPGPDPATLADPERIGEPALGGNSVPGERIPGNVTDPETLGQPSLVLTPTGGYGQGLYGVGLYGKGQQGQTDTTPDAPTSVSNYQYGAGTYNEGPYYGAVNADPKPTDNPTYGTGTYGYGIYYGTALPVTSDPALFGDIAGAGQPPLHIVGIGPWSPVIWWRGAPNYGVGAGNLPARPALALPAASSKGFTLRLNEGCEARAELNLPRGAGIVIDEMDTDLWWRRKDPRTKKVEIIGRFNTSHVNTSTSDSGLNVSLQFEDYRTLLGQRMVLRYLHPNATPDPESMWAKGTKITDILTFALPKNMRLDLSEVTGEDPYPLGVTTAAYHLPPGTTIADVMDGLNAISAVNWEWWVETPNDINQAPRLRFILGTRGLDKGVVLFDLGKGPSPIQSWTRNAAADSYANALFYTGGDGSIVQTIPAQINQYGQRDAAAGNSSIPGTEIQLMKARAQKKLASLATRAATYTIQLRRGFWRGPSHINVGDTITLIIRLGKETIREKHRVTEINVDIDANNAEDVTLTLGTPMPSPDPRSKLSPLQRLVRALRAYKTPDGADRVITEDD